MTISVSQLGNFLKAMVDSEVLLLDLNVEGEVSNYKLGSEAAFFVLKDNNAQIDCFFYNPPRERIEEGQRVVVSGKPNYYIKGGKLSFAVSKIKRQDEKGDKYKQLVLLKERLEREGLFDEIRKKPINRNCKKIGVITSAEGAVIQDIFNVCRRRNGAVDILVYDSRVQGADSEASLIRGLKYMDKTDVDNIIIARGGGSNEDLSSFNGENLVYAIAACRKPVISAVGHETNFTLCDFAADCRAATPSVAAELCTVDIWGTVGGLLFRLQNQSKAIGAAVDGAAKSLDMSARLLYATACGKMSVALSRLNKLSAATVSVCNSRLTDTESALRIAAARLDENNPAKILQKGFAVAEKDGGTVNSVADIAVGDELTVRFYDGVIRTSVVQTEVKNEF